VKANRRKCVSVRLAGAALALVLAGLTYAADSPAKEGIETLRVRPDFYLIAGAGGNVGVQVGPDGALLVDTGSLAAADEVIAAVKKITDQPIRFILNTNADGDHAGGNGKLSKAGQSIFNVGANANGIARAMTNEGGASILGPDAVLRRLSSRTGSGTAFPSDTWPTEAFFEKRKAIYFNKEGVEILRAPAAHTDADSIVFFRRSDVVMAGDVLDTTRYPVIDTARGGGINGEIDALNKLIELAIPPGPFIYQEGGTYVIAGHGRICSQFDVVEYRDMVVIIRDNIEGMIRQGMTLDQIKSANPTKAYDREYGATTGSWTTNNFVEAVYKSLTAKK